MAKRRVELLLDVRDKAGHAFARTYTTDVPDNLFRTADGRNEIMVTLEYIAREAYRRDVLTTVPFKCVSCGLKALCKYERYNWLQLTADSDVRVINQVKPVCQPGICEAVAEQVLIDDNFPGQESQHGVHHCEHCSKVDYARKCSRYKKVYYCSKQCQQLHWPHHKPDCKPWTG